MNTVKSDAIARTFNDEIDPIAEWENSPGDDSELGSKITIARRYDEYILTQVSSGTSWVTAASRSDTGAVARMASLFCDDKARVHDEEEWEEIQENYLEVDEEAPYSRDAVLQRVA